MAQSSRLPGQLGVRLQSLLELDLGSSLCSFIIMKVWVPLR